MLSTYVETAHRSHAQRVTLMGTEPLRRARNADALVAEIAQAGNYMETRRIGEEHAATAQALRELYDEWAKHAEPRE